MTIQFKVTQCNNIFSKPHQHAFMLDGDKKVEVKLKGIPKKYNISNQQSYSLFFYNSLNFIIDFLNLSCKPFNGEVNYTLGNKYVEVIHKGQTSQIELPSLCLSKNDPKYGFKKELPAIDDYEEYAYSEAGEEGKGEIKIKLTSGLISIPDKPQYPAYFGNLNSLHLITKSPLCIT